MKKLLLLLFAISLSLIGLAQNTSPLKTVNFHKIPNDIVDLKALKDAVGRDTDLDGNKAALIIVQTQGFNQKALLDFNYYTRGIEMIHHKIENGELWWYVASNSNGSIIIKYMGEYEFKIPQKLEAKSVYELILGMETATLVINTVPTNADIFIDGEKVGTGYASKAVSIGAEHRYKVQCNNYRPSEDVVYFEKREKKELNVNLEPNFSYITIKTEPSGADIYVDGTKVGETPYMSEPIAFGQHRVELRKTGYEKYAKVVIIKPEELENTQLENVTLTAARIPVGTLELLSNPVDAIIMINGRQYGQTPQTLNDFEAGTYTVNFSKEGYQDISQTVTVKDGKKETVNVTLSKMVVQQPVAQNTITDEETEEEEIQRKISDDVVKAVEKGNLEVKAGSYKQIPGFVNIDTEKMYDVNDRPYAVLKIRTENIDSKQRRELRFSGDMVTFFEVEYKTGEVWVYLSYYASYLRISHPDFGSTEFYFPFDMEPKKGYELTLICK